MRRTRVVRDPKSRIDYHGTTCLDYREIRAILETVDSFRLATNVDDSGDLVEVLVHGHETNFFLSCLREFRLEFTERMVRIVAVGKEK